MKKHLIFYLYIVFLLSSCSNIKYLPKGEMLYVGANVKIINDSLKKSDKDALKAELEALLRPKRNKQIFGLRPKLYIYNRVGTPKKDKGFKYWLKNKVGEPPVYFSKVDLDYNISLIQNRLENKGYFRAQTKADTSVKNKQVKVVYTSLPKLPYKIRKVVFPADSGLLNAAVKETEDKTVLKIGEAYSLEKIKEERDRIDGRLKEKGFYYFNPDYLIMRVDSTVGHNQIDVFVHLKNETPLQAKQIYTIDDIFIYPNYSLRDSAIANDKAVLFKDFKIIEQRETFKPQVFERTLSFHKGDVYNRTAHNLSLNRLVSLGTFKFVKNQFKESDSIKNNLNVFYYLTPLDKKSIRIELLAKTNSANYTGTEVNVNWSNRNTFKGAELLTVSAFGGFEVQVAGNNKGYNVYRFGTEASLFFPRFLTPFKKLTSSSAFVPRTKATIGYEFQSRINLYNLNSFKASFGYVWKESIKKEHQLDIIDLTYVNSSGVTQEYLNQIAQNPSLAKVIEKQLVVGPTYSFIYTNTTEGGKKNTFYYKGSLDLSGILLGIINPGKVSRGDTATFLNVPYSQFAKMEHDFRYYLKINERTKLANRVFVGAGLPYGNSNSLPFIKQFFSGGTNSVRAFRARSIGPGSYMPNVLANGFFPDQSGDYRLELNTELRRKLFSIVEGALFVDAGNVWLAHEDASRPGAALSKDFLKELAVGTGAGLRFDFSFLILRGDLAFPIRKPYLPMGDRWVIDNINFGSKQWRKDNLVFNLAIGYPF